MTAHLQSEDLQAEAAAAGRLMEAAYVQFKQTGAPEHSEEAVRHLRRRDAALSKLHGCDADGGCFFASQGDADRGRMVEGR